MSNVIDKEDKMLAVLILAIIVKAPEWFYIVWTALFLISIIMKLVDEFTD